MALLRLVQVAAAATSLLLAGCPGVPVRPDGTPVEEPCPAGAREAMAEFALGPGAAEYAFVDARQRGAGPLIVYDGPIESEMGLNMEELPPRTRLEGRVWTSGPRVVIRYYAARLPDGRRIPFCAIAGWNGPGLPKSPGRPGSAALEQTSARVYVVERFR